MHSACAQSAISMKSACTHRHTWILCELIEEIQSGSNQHALTVTRGSFASSSRRSLQRMSSTVRLAKRIEIFIWRAVLATRAWHVWSTGVMPDDEAH